MIGKGGTRCGDHAGAMGESFGDLTGDGVRERVRLRAHGRQEPVRRRRVRHRQQGAGIRNYGMNCRRPAAFPRRARTRDQPAQLQRLRLRRHRRRGARRRRDLERDELRDPAGADRQVQRRATRRRRRAPGATAPTARCRRGRARATAAGSSSCSTRAAHADGPSMLEARDAYLAADLLRFGGANQNELWQAFARRGFGRALEHERVRGQRHRPGPDFAPPGSRRRR